MSSSQECLCTSCEKWDFTIALSFDLTGGSVGSWLFCIQNFQCLVTFRCILGVRVEVWTNNIIHRLVGGQIHFNTFQPPRTSLALNRPIKNAILSDLHTDCWEQCTRNLPNMESVVCKTTNSGGPKLQLKELNDHDEELQHLINLLRHKKLVHKWWVPCASPQRFAP